MTYTADASTAPIPLAGAVMPQARQENFPVASLVLPRAVRSHLLAVYGFARLVDDVGDEFEGNRLAALDQLEADLERIWSGDGSPGHPLIARLKPTVVACRLPIEAFRKLIEANRQDQLVHRYETFEDLLAYCELSANPVGELVLRIFGAATPERVQFSNKVCSALQLVEHLQDVAEDYGNGRVYLPGEDVRRFGVPEAELGAGSASPQLRELISFEVRRARDLLDAGTPLVRTLHGRASFATAAFVAGGRAALNAIEHAHYDVLGSPVRATRVQRTAQVLAVLLGGGR
jgi:squalene synthase HpnC